RSSARTWSSAGPSTTRRGSGATSIRRPHGGRRRSTSRAQSVTELVPIGRVGRPHGRDGAFVVEDASEAPERLAVGAELLVDGEPARVVESKRAGGRRVVRLDRDRPAGPRSGVRARGPPGPGPHPS